MKKILVLVLLSVFVSPVFAADWLELMPKWYIDSETYTYDPENNTATAWLKILNDGHIPAIKNQKIWFILDKEEAICGERKMRMLQSHAYNLKKERVHSELKPYNFEEVVPSTKIEFVYKVLCGEFKEEE